MYSYTACIHRPRSHGMPLDADPFYSLCGAAYIVSCLERLLGMDKMLDKGATGVNGIDGVPYFSTDHESVATAHDHSTAVYVVGECPVYCMLIPRSDLKGVLVFLSR